MNQKKQIKIQEPSEKHKKHIHGVELIINELGQRER